MVTFNSFGRFGRLGNQLFQYAALRSLGYKNQCEIGLPSFEQINHHGQLNIIKNFNIPSNFFNKTSLIKKLTYKKYIEIEPEKIDKNFYNLKDKTDIKGYFQSIFYFKDIVDIIIKELTPKNSFLLKANKNLKKIKNKYKSYEIASLHIRRGDNVDPSINGNSLDLLKSFGKSNKLDLKSFFGKYIFNAKSILKKKKVKFLIFTGGSRAGNNISDYEWCKKNLIGDEYIFFKPQKEIDDFSLISVCDYNILSPGSSFGWWAAFINKKTKLTIAPKHYNPSEPSRKHRHMFYPIHWVIV
jgi:hypothetical protein